MTDTEQTVLNLSKRGFIAKRIAPGELFSELSEILPKGAKVGTGGSMTLKELGILPRLQACGYDVLSSETSTLSWEEQCESAKTADCFLTSSNAISLDGCLVNIDGRGNRVANMIYGIGTVVVIAGENKITPTLQDALDRAKNVAAPKNCVRLGKKTPCVKTGKCEDCSSPDRICRSTVIHTNPNSKTKTYVFIVDGSFGY